MFHIIEIPHQLPPGCWTAYDRTDFIRCVEKSNPCPEIIFNRTCVRKLMSHYHYENKNAASEDGALWLVDMLEKYSPETDLYSVGAGWTTNVIDEYTTYCKWLAGSLSNLIIFETSAEALAACEQDSHWCFHGGIPARTALKTELIEQGILYSEAEILKN